MSELAPVEGVVVPEQRLEPFSTREEAEQAMTRALLATRDGFEQLQLCRQRQAHALLGFQSWEDCVAAGFSEVLQVKIDQAYRMALVADARVAERLSTRAIAERLQVHASTVSRDLDNLRRKGMLPEEPSVVGSDGKTRPSRRAAAEETPAAERRREDLAKNWRAAVMDLGKRAEALNRLREDDRYASRLEELAESSRHELARVRELLQDILTDFQHQA